MYLNETVQDRFTSTMRTFRSLYLISSSSSQHVLSKSKFPKKNTFHPHFARCGLASLAPVSCRAAVVYGQGKPLQVESAFFDLLAAVNDSFNLSKVEEVEVLPPGHGEVKH